VGFEEGDEPAFAESGGTRFAVGVEVDIDGDGQAVTQVGGSQFFPVADVAVLFEPSKWLLGRVQSMPQPMATMGAEARAKVRAAVLMGASRGRAYWPPEELELELQLLSSICCIWTSLAWLRSSCF
jgi:hypothetical protein